MTIEHSDPERDQLPADAEAPNQNGIGLIAAERQRQVSAEGWTAAHDAGHTDGELIQAAVCYLAHDYHGDAPRWPWDAAWWKPKDPIRNLVRAGALIAAEIDRRLREQGKFAQAPSSRADAAPQAETPHKS